MVGLVDERKTAPHTFLRGVHPLKFRTAGDIIRKLSLAAGPASILNPAASPFVPGQARSQANEPQPPVEAPTEANEADESIQEDPEEEEDTESPPEAVDVAAMIGPIGTQVTKISEEDLAKQEHAAKTLQFHYRRLLESRANQIANPGLGLPKTRKDKFDACAQVADSIEWPKKSLYRPIFLGALPHLLVCIDRTWTIVVEAKAKVKKAARSDDKHEAIEELMKRQTKIKWVHEFTLPRASLANDCRTLRCSGIMKRLRGLQADVKETSDLHKRRDLEELKVYVGRVADVLEEVPQAKEELEFDMRMASAWVYVLERRRKRK
jgi:hypothetical protein